MHETPGGSRTWTAATERSRTRGRRPDSRLRSRSVKLVGASKITSTRSRSTSPTAGSRGGRRTNQMPQWSYLHFAEVRESDLKRQYANRDVEETPLQSFLNMYGQSNWELIHVGRPSSDSYELIFKAPA